MLLKTALLLGARTVIPETPERVVTKSGYIEAIEVKLLSSGVLEKSSPMDLALEKAATVRITVRAGLKQGMFARENSQVIKAKI